MEKMVLKHNILSTVTYNFISEVDIEKMTTALGVPRRSPIQVLTEPNIA